MTSSPLDDVGVDVMAFPKLVWRTGQHIASWCFEEEPSWQLFLLNVFSCFVTHSHNMIICLTSCHFRYTSLVKTEDGFQLGPFSVCGEASAESR